MNKFSDFGDTSVMDGQKASMKDVFDKKIMVLQYRINNTKYADAKNPKCLTIQFAFMETPNEHKVVFTGSAVLMDQLEKYKDKIPFEAVVKRAGKSFVFT